MTFEPLHSRVRLLAVRRSLALAVVAAAVTVVLLGVVGPFAAGGESSAPPPLQCDSGDSAVRMENSHAKDAKGTSAEDAVGKEVTTVYPGLKASMLTRTDEKSDAVQLTLMRDGRRLAVVNTVKIGSGWGVDEMTACNHLIQEVKGQG
jgi:hypothetical protein